MEISLDIKMLSDKGYTSSGYKIVPVSAGVTPSTANTVTKTMCMLISFYHY